MLKKRKLYLQLFAEGGEGGDGGSASQAGEALGTQSGDNIPASIPEKAKKYYQKAVERKNARQQMSPDAGRQSQTDDNPAQTTTEPNTTEELSYEDLIKSDKYKAAHQAYVEKIIADRFKNHSDLKAENARSKELLEIVAGKYGVDMNAQGGLENLKAKIEADNSYYEDYAMKNDISVDEARKVVSMERRLKQVEAQNAENERQAQMRQQLVRLHQNAAQTKLQFPEFDLDKEMQNESFRKMCVNTNGDTTAAYMACHYKEIMQANARTAVQQARQQTAQTVASNKARPAENGISSQAPTVVTQSFKGMNIDQLRAYADEQRRLKGRR